MTQPRQRVSTIAASLLVGKNEERGAADEDEDDQTAEDHQWSGFRRILFFQCAHDEKQRGDADSTDQQSDDDHRGNDFLGTRFHGVNISMRSRPAALPREVDAAIFDFDETLIDLEPQHTFAYMELCRAMESDYAQMPEAFRKGSGRRVIDDIVEMRLHFDWTPPVDELFALRQRFFESACRSAELSLMDGASELVVALSDRGIRLAVTSSAVRGPIIEILSRFDLLDRFELIVDGSEVTRGKPDPEAYLVTARKLEVRAGACIVFEDSNVGVRAAAAAGMVCIAIPNPNAQISQDVSVADLVLSSLREFDPEWIASRVSDCG